MPIPQWKWIPDYEGRYKVSSDGQVMSFLFHKEGKIVKPDLVANGYVRIHLQFKKTWLLHRLVAIVFIPNPDKLSTVNHKDGNKHNNAVENLEWSSYSDNMKHSWRTLKTHQNRKNSLPRGEANFNSKLSASQVLAIRSAYAKGGTSQQKLAVLYKVSKPAIRAVINRKTWAHI